MKKEKVPIITRVEPEIKALAEMAAQSERRSLSTWLALLLEKTLKPGVNR